MKNKAKTKLKTLHIFRPGRHRPMQGGALNFTEADLVQCARVYDPDLHEAPIVIGHPASNGPAHGWVGSLIADKTGLRAVPRQINPEFAEAARGGAFKKISASFYPPDSPDNPVPGSWYLRHVGVLGAQVPAIKGLEQFEFGEGETGIVTFEENIDADGEISGTGLFAQLRAWLIKNRGQEVADDVLPEDKLKKLQEQVEDAPADAKPTDAEVKPDAPAEDVVAELAHQVAEQAETIAQLAEEKEKLAEKLEAEEGQAAAGEAAEFAERLIREGRVLPRHRAAVVAFMEMAAGRKPRRNTSGVIEFGEGERVRPLLPAFKAFLASLPPSVQFGEVAPKNRAAVAKPAVNPLIADAQRRKHI